MGTRTTFPCSLSSTLFDDVRRLIEQARARTAVAVNVGQTLLYWQVGRRVGDEILGGERAAYGERTIVELARALEVDYGRGFAEKNLRRMVQFAEAFSDSAIVATLSRQLSWSQFVLLLPVKDSLARDFYAEMCRVEGWNVRILRAKIQSMLFERTSLSRKPEQLARKELATLRSEDRMTPDMVFRDPYLLDFVAHLEKRTLKQLWYGSLAISSWSWAWVSRSSNDRSASPSMDVTTTWTCFSITGACVAWSRLS